MIDKLIDNGLKAVFSVPSFFIHVCFLIVQVVFNVNENVITNYISWEAIFLALMIGIQQLRHHDSIQDAIKDVDKGTEDSDNKVGA